MHILRLRLCRKIRLDVLYNALDTYKERYGRIFAWWWWQVVVVVAASLIFGQKDGTILAIPINLRTNT